MKNPLKKEQEHITSLLKKDKPLEVFEYLIGLLKSEKKDDIILKLLSISYLDFIASEYFLPKKEEQNLLKSLGKAEKLIKELKTFKADELKEMLLNFEASLNQSRFEYKLLKGENYLEILEKHLQLAISNYWRSLRISKREDEKYNTRNNLANCLVKAGRFIEAISLFNENINQNPNRFQSFASWGHAMENLKEAFLFRISREVFKS